VPNFTLAPWHHGATAFFGTLVPQVVPTPTPRMAAAKGLVERK